MSGTPTSAAMKRTAGEIRSVARNPRRSATYRSRPKRLPPGAATAAMCAPNLPSCVTRKQLCNLPGRLQSCLRVTQEGRFGAHMAAVAAPGGSRLGRLRYVAERRGFLATLLISPAVLFIAALVGVPLILAIYLSFTEDRK